MNPRLMRIPDGQKTQVIYGYIRDERYQDAINILNHELQFCQRGRVMSLLGYCYYMSQDYQNSSRIYEELSYAYPNHSHYKYYCALSCYKSGEYETALRVLTQIEDQSLQNQIATLIAYIKYDIEDYQRARTLIQNREHDDLNFTVLQGAIYYKEGKIEQALRQFEKAKAMAGGNCELIYNVALAHYKNKEYDKCMQFIAEIIEKGTQEHQDLCMGMRRNEEEEFVSVGNSLALKESALVEAFNLKAAIEFNLKNISNAKEALSDMPPRKEEELDPVTLMNRALVFFESDPSGGFQKLNFLLENPPFPQETFCNLLLLYAKHEYFDLAADILAENSDLSFKFIKPEDYQYIEALIFQNASLEDATIKFENLGKRHLENLKRITRQIKESQKSKDNAALQKTLKDYDDTLEVYIPVLMAHAKIYWNKENFAQVERIFKQSQDFCSINETWKLNLAHTYFIQEKYIEALTHYETIYEKHIDNILEIPAIVIANLCVSCIMVNQNDRAEEIIRILEEAEQKEEEQNGESNQYHLCIVNLVIGTLYCSKNNYEFGMTRVIKSFDPLKKKLCTDTWYYAKRCFLSLLEKLTKNMFILQDQIIIDILTFLINCEEAGSDIKTKIDPTGNFDEKNSVAYEARLLRIHFIKLRE